MKEEDISQTIPKRDIWQNWIHSSSRSTPGPLPNTGSGTGASASIILSTSPRVKSGAIIDPEKIRWLKNFTSKFIVQGQLIHDIIDKQIQLHCENKPMDLAEAMNVFSKKVSLYKNIGGETFTEYHNGEKIPGSFYAAIEENGKTCLRTFFGK